MHVELIPWTASTIQRGRARSLPLENTMLLRYVGFVATADRPGSDYASEHTHPLTHR